MSEMDARLPRGPAIDDELMTTAEVAKLLRVRTETVLRWVADGRLPARKTPGGQAWRYRAADVYAFMEEGVVESE